MEIIYSETAQEDIAYWKKSGNKGVQKKIQTLIEDILKHPYEGIGKPHALKHNLSGSWARRISDEHRVVYSVDENLLKISSLRGHYE